jgi:hypothetical protein
MVAVEQPQKKPLFCKKAAQKTFAKLMPGFSNASGPD